MRSWFRCLSLLILCHWKGGRKCPKGTWPLLRTWDTLYCYRVKQLLLHWKCLDTCSEIRGRCFSLCLGGKSVLVGQIQPVLPVWLLSFQKPIFPFDQSTHRLLGSRSSHKHKAVKVGKHLCTSGPTPAQAGLLATSLPAINLTLNIFTSTTNLS